MLSPLFRRRWPAARNSCQRDTSPASRTRRCSAAASAGWSSGPNHFLPTALCHARKITLFNQFSRRFRMRARQHRCDRIGLLIERALAAGAAAVQTLSLRSGDMPYLLTASADVPAVHLIEAIVRAFRPIQL